MFKAYVSNDTAITANTNIPFTVTKNTNLDIKYDSTNKQIIFNRPGHYLITFHAVGNNIAAGDITIFETLNNVQSDEVFSSSTSTGTSAFYSFDIPDILSIYAAPSTSNALLSFQSDTAATITSGILTIVKIGR